MSRKPLVMRILGFRPEYRVILHNKYNGKSRK